MAETTLRLVAHSDLKVLDPIGTTAFISRNHGYMIYDVLFAKDAQGDIQPQMVDKYQSSPDKLTWTFTLRSGLEWHDGKPVTAEDCVASIKRWAARDTLGQQMMAAVGEIEALDDASFRISLKEPFGLLLEALGKPRPACVHDAQAGGGGRSYKQIDDYTGSGRSCSKDEWKAGEKIVYSRFPN
jgi:peptide/nickel transport system substrate-binding protein